MKKRPHYYKSLYHFLSYITSVKFQVVYAIILLCIGIWMFFLSIHISSPELKEYNLYVDERTTSPKDTIKAFFLQCLLNVSSIINNETGEVIKNAHSVIDANFDYKLNGISFSSIKDKGLVPIEKIVDKSISKSMHYRWFKQMCITVPEIEIEDNLSISFPDTLSQVVLMGKNNTQVMLLGRTVPHGQIKMTIFAKNGIFSPQNTNNPYITAYFNFNFRDDVIDLDERSKINIETGNKRNKDGILPNPINIMNVWPAPDHVGPDGITYNTVTSVSNALKNGIYITAEDLNKRKKSDRETFAFTLFLGIIVTMLIDNIISLIKKWKVFIQKNINDDNQR